MPYGDFDLDVADRSRLRERRRGEPCNGAITEKARSAGTSGAGAGTSGTGASGAGASSFGTFGRQLLDAQGQVAETRYLHGDLIRSTNLTTDGAGTAAQTVAYTAFGELVADDGQGGTRIGAYPPAGFPRYQYAGGWGYEADLLTLGGAPTSLLPPIRLLHVGARWYQPDIGRFVMRDGLGIPSGINVYLYALNQPLLGVDPSGLDWFDPSEGDPESGVGVILVVGGTIIMTVASGGTVVYIGGGLVVVGTVLWGDDDLAALAATLAEAGCGPPVFGDGYEPPLDPTARGVDCRGCHRLRPVYWSK